MSNNELTNKMTTINMNDIKFNVYLIRHGFACHNLFKSKKRRRKQLYYSMRSYDPHLSAQGALGSYAMGKYIKEKTNIPIPDYVFTSRSIRTIETAMLMFPKQYEDGVMFSIDGLKESGGIGNEIQRKKSAIKSMKTFISNVENLEKFDKSDNKLEHLFSLSNDKFRSEQYEFKIVIQDIIDAIIKEEKDKKDIKIQYGGENNELSNESSKKEKKTEIDIVIVGHSNYIKKNVIRVPEFGPFNNNNRALLKKGKKPKNNQIIEFVVEYEKLGLGFNNTGGLSIKKVKVYDNKCDFNKKTKKLECKFNNKNISLNNNIPLKNKLTMKNSKFC